MDCSICLNPLSDQLGALPCISNGLVLYCCVGGHVFHGPCIGALQQGRLKCPLCRVPFESAIPLFLSVTGLQPATSNEYAPRNQAHVRGMTHDS